MSQIDELKIKERRIRELQDKRSRVEGKREQLSKDLRDKFNCSTTDEGRKLLAEKKQELDKIDIEVNDLHQDMDSIIERAIK